MFLETNGFANWLFLIFFVVFMALSFVIAFIVSNRKFEVEYMGHKIKVSAKPLKMLLYIDDKLIDSCSSVFTLHEILKGSIGEKQIRAHIKSGAFSYKCEIFVAGEMIFKK